jgi:hypothetical protein
MSHHLNLQNQSSFCKDDSRLAIQIPCLLYNSKAITVFKSSRHCTAFSQLNFVHTVTTCFFQIPFSNILKFRVDFLTDNFPTHILHASPSAFPDTKSGIRKEPLQGCGHSNKISQYTQIVKLSRPVRFSMEGCVRTSTHFRSARSSLQ